MNELIEAYLACWNETHAIARRALIERTWAADGRLSSVHGRLDTVPA